jgi:hypothetical protein
MRMTADNEDILSRYRLHSHMMHFLIRLSAGSTIMGKKWWEKSYVRKKGEKEKLTERKEVMAKWGKRSEGNNGKANKRNKVQEKK